MRRTLTFLYDGGLFLAALSLIGIFLLMVGESIVRYLGGYITGASEMVGWLCASAGLLALPATFKRGDMVRVGFLVDELPPALRRLALAACLAVAFVFVSYMVYAVAGYIWSGWRSEEMTQGMIEIPVWIPQSSFLVGSFLLWVAIVDELFVTFTLPADQLRAEKAMSADDVSVH
jgi:TRAP-type C4-dicarboxylate transport system permease small subunit